MIWRWIRFTRMGPEKTMATKVYIANGDFGPVAPLVNDGPV